MYTASSSWSIKICFDIFSSFLIFFKQLMPLLRYYIITFLLNNLLALLYLESI